jgi:hypothetical protein
MEKTRLSSFNKQLSRVYSLAILHIILSFAGLLLNYLRLNSQYLYFSIITLNLVALFCFEPWKIMGYLNQGYGYKQGLAEGGEQSQVIAQEKGVKNGTHT